MLILDLSYLALKVSGVSQSISCLLKLEVLFGLEATSR